MSNSTTVEPENENTEPKPKKSRKRWIWRAGAVGIVLIVGIVYFTGQAETRIDSATYKVNRGDLRISVVEGGQVESQGSQEIRSEVQGQTRIIQIVDEGYRVTEEDIENGLVLVELDSAEIQERLTQQEITYLGALSSLTDAKEQYEIQISQNESDIREAELAVKFARMDIEKYLGAEVAIEVLDEMDIDEEALFKNVTMDDLEDVDEEMLAELEEEVDDEAETEEVEINLDVSDPNEETVPKVEIDTLSMLQDSRLGGEAQQTLRRMETDITLAQEELKQAETRHEWTERLYEQGFVTASEEEQDRMTVQRREVQLQQAETAEDLFLNYEFPKEIEQFISDYEQSIRRLERVRRQALSRLAQADSQLRSSEATYNLQRQRLNEYQEQLENCIIRAEREGIVVYAGGNDPFRNQEPIEEGTQVRERQEILTIPDMSSMAVRVSVHESSINRVRQGQPAIVRADAFPDEMMRGEVVRVAMLPDSSRRWMNPDISVFATTIAIDGMHEWLKPGMSAQGEIIIAEYEDVLYVPLQAVTQFNGQRVCYVVEGGSVIPRVVEVGDYNDRHIHIIDGLEEGEEVLLRPPRPDGQSAPREETDALLSTPGDGVDLPEGSEGGDGETVPRDGDAEQQRPEADGPPEGGPEGDTEGQGPGGGQGGARGGGQGGGQGGGARPASSGGSS